MREDRLTQRASHDTTAIIIIVMDKKELERDGSLSLYKPMTDRMRAKTKSGEFEYLECVGRFPDGPADAGSAKAPAGPCSTLRTRGTGERTSSPSSTTSAARSSAPVRQ